MSGANASERRKALDTRIPALISNSLLTSHRSFFLMVGDQAKMHQQIVNLHFLLSQSIAGLANPTDAQKKNPRPNVLWCYRKDLGFTSNRKKRESKVKREVKRGERDVGQMDPFELFVSVTDVRYTYYKDTHKILGQTFNMLVLQDFEAITPNLLARTIETVEGGGIVVCLLQGMKSLRGLYSMTMDVHNRYRSASSNAAPVARFNERFLLSLGSNPSCLVVDDELNVLPISAGKDIVPIDPDLGVGVAKSSGKGKRREQEGEAELRALKESMADTKGVGEVLAEARTLDQAKAILTFTDAITSKSLSQTVSLTAGRGRGKSAALGLSIALAVLHSYSNIFVTSPSPENLKTLFEFIFKGFDKLGWEEHLDYEIVQSTNPEWKGAVVRVNIFRQHRQTIQYIQPQDYHVLGQAELVVIDEAAAIPLPVVRSLLGPYLVFMASTINGYEGTGRSLSLKLLQQLREMSRPASALSVPGGGGGGEDKAASGSGSSHPLAIARQLKEIKLTTPIRYAPGDAIESWLNQLLCLDASLAQASQKKIQGCPHPSQCELFYVNRDTLFSYHPASEAFLQRMMSLYVASHYKNSPDDLQLMSDAPGHHLFVLLPPIKEGDQSLPEPLVVLQVALEGNISKETVMNELAKGKGASGDLIPWTISQQYQDDDFASLSGARVVRVATHPDYAGMGYGKRSIQQLNSFYSGELLNLDEVAAELEVETFADAAKVDSFASLSTDRIGIRDAAKMPPLLQRLSERQPENLDWLGVSYGMTPSLLRFWKSKELKFAPLYIRSTENEITGEHSCVMLRGLNKNQDETTQWLGDFALDFRKRFSQLLSFKLRKFDSMTALHVLDAATKAGTGRPRRVLSAGDVRELFSPFDLKRLASYANNQLDWHVIVDLLPTLASLHFAQRFPADVKISAVQSRVLCGMGLQRKSVDELAPDLDLPAAQILSVFMGAMKTLSKALQQILRADTARSLPSEEAAAAAAARLLPAVAATAGASGSATQLTGKDAIAKELEEEGSEVLKKLREEQREVIDSLDLKQYAIGGSKDEWAAAEAAVAARMTSGKAGLSSVVSVKNPSSTKGQKRKAAEEQQDASAKGKKEKKDKKRKKQ